MAVNKINLERDGLIVGDTQLVASGGGITIGQNLAVIGNSYVEKSQTITGNLTVNGNVSLNSNLYVANNLGIGTASPTAKFQISAVGGSNPNFIMSGPQEQTFRFYNTSTTGSTRVSWKMASRLNTDWEWIWFTDSTGAGINDLTLSNLSGSVMSIAANRNITFGGTVADVKGDVRAAPIQTKISAYIAVQSDAGQTIYISTGGVTINASVFNAGDMVTIINNSGSNQTITAGASVTFRLAGTATTGNRTLAQRGMATFVCVVGGATPDFYCSGAGLT